MSLAVTGVEYLAQFGVTTNAGTFGLHASRDESFPLASRVNALSWTWPARLLTNFSNANVHWYVLTLQRSTSSSIRPNAVVVYPVGTHQQPVADAAWTTVKTWSYAEFLADPNQSTYSDPWAINNPVAYRLIVNFAKGNDPILPPYGEMTWNIALIVPSQPLTVKRDSSTIGQDGNQYTLLSWTPPDVSWWP